MCSGATLSAHQGVPGSFCFSYEQRACLLGGINCWGHLLSTPTHLQPMAPVLLQLLILQVLSRVAGHAEISSQTALLLVARHAKLPAGGQSLPKIPTETAYSAFASLKTATSIPILQIKKGNAERLAGCYLLLTPGPNRRSHWFCSFSNLGVNRVLVFIPLTPLRPSLTYLCSKSFENVRQQVSYF